MALGSGIEWTQATWNPLTGCNKVSQGCKHCYAERMASRLQAMGQPHYQHGFQLALHEDALALPLQWRRPRTIFVNSMSDLFHEGMLSAFRILERMPGLYGRDLLRLSVLAMYAARRRGRSVFRVNPWRRSRSYEQVSLDALPAGAEEDMALDAWEDLYSEDLDC